MIRLRAVFLAVLLCCFSWASNSLAQDIIQVDTGGDVLLIEDAPILVAPNEPILVPIEEPVLAPTYSPENPFATSEYTDLANVAEVIIAAGGNIDSYFYSEGFTTGIDGQLGNENVCIRDDTNRVYIGRSDVCTNRKESDYSYIYIDQVDLSNFSLSSQQTQPPLFDPDQIYQTDDMIGNTSQYWDGCYSIDQGWSGTSGGSCPTINDQYDGQINFGYVNKTLTNTAAIDQALKGAGLETTGYTYSWRVKNADANWTTTGNGRAQADPFEVTVKIYDENGNSVYEKSYDYSYWMDWTSFSGSEEFDDPFNLDEISELQLSVTGYDIGYWAGYYGPEFADPSIKLNYRVAQEEDTTVEDVLFDQMCANDPMYDISCPGYNDAMLAQITSSSSLDNTTDESDIIASVQSSPDDNTGAETESFSQPEVQGSSSGIVEESQAEQPIVQEQIASQEMSTSEPVEETVSDEVASDPQSEEEKKSTGLNANQLMALNIAENATSAAQSTASTSAQQSAGIGLSESGGISSELTADGVSNADGSLSSSIASITTNASSNSMSGSDNTSMSGMQNTTQSNTSSSDNTSSITSSLSNNFNTTSQSSSETSSGNSTTQTGLVSNSLSGSENMSLNNSTDLLTTSLESSVDITVDTTVQDNNQLTYSNNFESNEAEFDLSTDMQVEQQDNFNNESFDVASLDVQDLNNLDISNPIIDDIINNVTNTIIREAVQQAEEVAEESAEESFESQNAKEDELVAAAQAGSDDEDAQAALLGYNPNFRAYQQPQIPGGDIYNDQGVYEDQKTYDNPDARFFNGASDTKHREMIRQQYERN